MNDPWFLYDDYGDRPPDPRTICAHAIIDFGNGDIRSAENACNRLVLASNCPDQVQIDAWQLLALISEANRRKRGCVVRCLEILEDPEDICGPALEFRVKETMEKLKVVEDALEEEAIAKGEDLPDRWTEKGKVYYTPAAPKPCEGPTGDLGQPATDLPAPTKAKKKRKTKGKALKNKVCRFWEQGECRKGDKCGYVHGGLLKSLDPNAPAFVPAAIGGQDEAIESEEVHHQLEEGKSQKGDDCDEKQKPELSTSSAPEAPAPSNSSQPETSEAVTSAATTEVKAQDSVEKTKKPKKGRGKKKHGKDKN